MSIHNYVMVKDRLKEFRSEYPRYTLDAQVMDFDQEKWEWVLMKATITDEEGKLISSGHAFESKSSSPTNRTSMVENCETSAWGRALANMGYSIDKSVASAEEMKKVDRSYNGTQQHKQMLKRILTMLGVTDRETAVNIQTALMEEGIEASEPTIISFVKEYLKGK